MTIDDESSVYVGGLSYSATEHSVRKVFDHYGSVVAVKIVNDRSTRGKCYGFVTFANPRSAVDAINGMNGRTIDGRVVRVNEVTTRGGKLNSGRDQFQRGGRDKGRDRERDNHHHRDRYQDWHNDKPRELTPSVDYDKDIERQNEHVHDHGLDWDRSRDPFLDKDQERDVEKNEQGHSRIHDQEWERKNESDMTRDKEIDRIDGYHRSVDDGEDHLLRKHNGSAINDQPLREPLSNSSEDNHDQQVKDLDRSIQRREELKKEISQMEERMDGKEQLILDLQKKSKKLEESLINVKKLSSQRQKQLSKMYKCFMQAKAYAERLKSCEQELQSIVDLAMIESDIADDVYVKDGGVLTNGNA